MKNIMTPFAAAAPFAQDRAVGMSGTGVFGTGVFGTGVCGAGTARVWGIAVAGADLSNHSYVDVPNAAAARTTAVAKQGAPPRGEPR